MSGSIHFDILTVCSKTRAHHEEMVFFFYFFKLLFPWSLSEFKQRRTCLIMKNEARQHRSCGDLCSQRVDLCNE